MDFYFTLNFFFASLNFHMWKVAWMQMLPILKVDYKKFLKLIFSLISLIAISVTILY